MTLNQKFVQYLMASYLYYVENRSILSDTEFDQLCMDLLAGWDQLDHRHKHLTTKEDLEAGTGYAIQYPSIVIGAARHWYYSVNPPAAPRRRRATRKLKRGDSSPTG